MGPNIAGAQEHPRCFLASLSAVQKEKFERQLRLKVQEIVERKETNPS
jgi:hypothetical protein